MLQSNRLKAALKEGRTVFGLLNSIPAPLLVEMIGYAGYDFVILDMEHMSVNPETLDNMIRAAECAGITPLVRVPSAARETILRVLDAGAQGIVVPHVRNRAEAQQAVAASRYHPLGERGISGGRTTGFGTIDLVTYLERANREIMAVVMIEDLEGVERIDEIVSVPGVDMVLEGAIDLSQSFGVPGQAQHPAVQEAIQQIAACCQKNAVAFCAIPRLPEQFGRWREQGVNAFLLGDDRSVSFRALKANCQQYTDRHTGEMQRVLTPAPAQAAQPAPQKPDAVTLAIDAQGQIFWNREPIAMAELRARLAQAAAQRPQPDVRLHADRNTRYQELAEVMAAAQNAGLQKMGFITDPSEARQQGATEERR